LIRKRFDVLVIGGGISGTLAASYLAGKGRKVGVLKKAGGATAMSSGLLDVLGYVDEELIRNPEEGVRNLAEKNPDHPYGLTGGGREESASQRGQVAVEKLREALDFFRAGVKAAGHEYEGSLDENVLAITPFGTYKPTCLLPPWMYSDISGLDGSKILFVGSKNNPRVNPVYIAKSFEGFILPKLREIGIEIEAEAKAEYVGAPGLEGRRYVLPVEVGYSLDVDENLKKYTENISEKLGDSTHVFLPCLGYRKPRENWEYIKEKLGVEVVELPSLPPSTAGMRLASCLEEMASKGGVELYKGYSAVSAKIEGAKCLSVEAVHRNEVSEAEASAFVLATGDYISDDLLVEKDRIVERAFGLRIETPEDQDYLSWLDDTPFPVSGHPASRLGVKVDRAMRPLVKGDVLAENLFACGSVIAGYDYNTEKCGFGVCISTALAAAEGVLDYL